MSSTFIVEDVHQLAHNQQNWMSLLVLTALLCLLSVVIGLFCSVGDYGVSAQDIIPGDVNEAPLTQLAPSHPTSQLVDRVFVEKEG